MEPEYELAFKVSTYIDLIWAREELQETIGSAAGDAQPLAAIFDAERVVAFLAKLPSDDAALRDAIETVSLYREARILDLTNAASVVPVVDPAAPNREGKRGIQGSEDRARIADQVAALLWEDFEALRHELVERLRDTAQGAVVPLRRKPPGEGEPAQGEKKRRRDTPAKSPAAGRQPSFEAFRRGLATRFYEHPEIAADIAKKIDYFPSFTVELSRRVHGIVVASFESGGWKALRLRWKGFFARADSETEQLLRDAARRGRENPRHGMIEEWNTRKAQPKRAQEAFEWMWAELAAEPSSRGLALRDLGLLFLRRPLLAYWMARHVGVSVPFGIAFGEELDEIYRSRQARLPEGKGSHANDGDVLGDKWFDPYSKGYEMKLSGLCFSGGGIRSATFNLGVLQALSDLKMVSRFDYLSTVSGGGYIGSWLAAWSLRAGGILTTEALLQRKQSLNPLGEDLHPIRRLREYSHYLTPQSGAVTTDTLTLIAVYVRNLILNQTLLILVFLAALLLPLLLFPGLNGAWGSTQVLLFASSLLMLLSGLNSGIGLRTFKPNSMAARQGAERGTSFVHAGIVAPVVLASVFAAFSLWSGARMVFRSDWYAFLKKYLPFHPDGWTMLTFVCSLAVVALAHLIGSWRTPRYKLSSLLFSLGFVPPALIAALCFLGIRKLFAAWTIDTQEGAWRVLVFGLPLILAVWSATVIAYLGIVGRAIGEERREWWARLGAIIGLCAAAYLILASVSVYGPTLLYDLSRLNITLAALWSAITALGLKLGGAAPKTAPDGEASIKDMARRAIVAIAPYVFIAGLFLILSWVAFRIAAYASFGAVPTGLLFAHYWQILGSMTQVRVELCLACAALALALGYTLGVNEFSMHNFYKNRLVRAYLAASRPSQRRHPNAFTGFDPDDDLPLARLRVNPDPPSRRRSGFWDRDTTMAPEEYHPHYVGPFPIFNTTLNITKGQDLALQERKGESFTFTPLRCGFHYTRPRIARLAEVSREFAFCRTEDYAYPGGPTVGDAMTISGAAANPSWGANTSTGTAFLFTLFNLRLGSWIGNPATRKSHLSSPLFGLIQLLYNLLGSAGSQSEFINLSDGGHFDNSGLYELIRRRARYIMICDAEEDKDFTFGALGGAIRKARIDFAADVRIDVRNLVPVPGADSKCHCAAGEVVYDDQSVGQIIYLKLSLDGAEPTDILEYKKRAPAFPHQTTADQFFSESQFESYRILGYYSAQLAWSRAASSAESSAGGAAPVGMGEIFQEFSQVWPDPSHVADGLRPHYDHVLSAHTWGPDATVTLEDALERIAVTHRLYHELRLWHDREWDIYLNRGIRRILVGWTEHPVQQQAWKRVQERYEPLFRFFYDNTLSQDL